MQTVKPKSKAKEKANVLSDGEVMDWAFNTLRVIQEELEVEEQAKGLVEPFFELVSLSRYLGYLDARMHRTPPSPELLERHKIFVSRMIAAAGLLKLALESKQHQGSEIFAQLELRPRLDAIRTFLDDSFAFWHVEPSAIEVSEIETVFA